MTITFGTDGWRGIISRDFTFANVRRVVAAIGAYLEEQGTSNHGVAVAYDRRFLSEQYAAEAAGVLAASGVPVQLAATPLPTPVLSWAVRQGGLGGGIMITASHNPPAWNGIKFKESFGGPARGPACRRIEELLAGPSPAGDDIACLPPDRLGRCSLVSVLDAWEGYGEALQRLVDFDALRRAGPRVAVDCMHGSGTPWLRRLLEQAGCHVVELHGDHNPGFRGVPPEPIAANLAELEEAVRVEGCRLGLATDGDADRIGAVDERGRYFSTQRIFAVLLHYLREHKGLRGDAAKAVSATSMIDLLASRHGFEVVLTPIGFKHLAAAMLERDILIGGEESGGIGISAHLPERDGLLNALLLAEIVATGSGLREYVQQIFDEVGYFTYDRIDLRLDREAIQAVRDRMGALREVGSLAGRPVREVLALDGTRLLRDDASWLLIRPSGTEPLLRIYAEARSRAEVEELLREGRRLAGL
ncbi:MAG: phosphoglucomutase/phosphomannomutase family protein [Deltaproteobacteria bacterium]|nr:phosphoglucomutase/phosphomannomutase family protein [Deltaproteobacteria bacterium]